MTTPQVISEVASVINAVISVIASSVFKILPVLVVMVIGLSAMDVFVGALFEEDAYPQSPILSGSKQPELQLSSNTGISTLAVNAE